VCVCVQEAGKRRQARGGRQEGARYEEASKTRQARGFSARTSYVRVE
jgi:hypothetical protein